MLFAGRLAHNCHCYAAVNQIRFPHRCFPAARWRTREIKWAGAYPFILWRFGCFAAPAKKGRSLFICAKVRGFDGLWPGESGAERGEKKTVREKLAAEANLG